ncbi:MAG TPA: thiamine biosynthesis protein ThiJ [Lachnospiraceae bacterium]|nr:DJ-1/PfpI family protein [uncultured Lachnoclostridium sp.]HAU88279.1 thiamine biosynthesis protein ThiJ [Lachnospiraceae bacterium]
MKIAFIIFEGVTALDFIGTYDPISRLKTMGFKDNLEVDICSYQKTVDDFSSNIHFTDLKVVKELSKYDMIIIPGGFGTRTLMKEEDFLAWIKTSREDAIKASVCTGALIWAAAGYLSGKHATTHFNSFDTIKDMGVKVEAEKRVVEDGNMITARGVSAGIDLGLFICEKIQGKEVRDKIARQMDYHY